MSLLLPALAMAQGKGGKGGKGAKGAKPDATTSAPTAAPTTPAAPTETAPAATPTAPAAPAGSAAPPPLDEATRKEQARQHFERGIALSDEEAWDAALVEFARSRELFATRGNTKNMALSLRKLQRFDEALDSYETLVREFPTMTPQDRAFVDKELEELRKRVGTLEISSEAGATVRVDNRARGTTPLAGPMRVSAGSHVVRIFKDGFVPFEGRVDVLGGQGTKLDAKLETLVQSGRLRIAEQSGKQVDVEIDHNVVGKTPWEGPVPPGEHSVLLRGEGNLGTPPASVPVKLNETASITLAVEALESEIRVEPQPVNATVAIDGISVGRGLWNGRLRSGEHTVEVGSEGFLPERRKVTLRPGSTDALTIVLERDPNSPIWRRLEPPRVVVGLDARGALGILPIGGEVTENCSGDCSRGLPLGGVVSLRGGYQLGSGLGFGLEVGYLALRQRIEGRAETLSPVGLADNPGLANDTLFFQGLHAGATAWFRRGKPLGWAAQIGAGVVLGTMRDARDGEFFTAQAKVNGSGVPYRIDTVVESEPARYIYVSPEARITYRLGARGEIGFGAQVMVLAALSPPRWQDKRPLLTGSCITRPPPCETDGQARFGDRTTGSQVMVMINPGVSLRYEF